MFRQRLWALMLAVVLLVGTLMPAQADVAEEYEGAQQALRAYLMGDPEEDIAEIFSWFDSCRDYGMSYAFRRYAECLMKIDQNDFSMVASNIGLLRRDSRFTTYLAEHEFASLDDLQRYADGREAESAGDKQAAIGYYAQINSQVRDNSRRQSDLEESLLQERYAEAMAHFDANTYEDAKIAFELFSELADAPYMDSAAKRDQSESLRESLRSVSARVTGSGLSRTIYVTANSPWTARADAAWISLSSYSGTGNGTITVTLPIYIDTVADRVGKVTFTCGASVYELEIVQEKRDFVSASESGEGNTRTINVTANGSWTASCEDAWVSMNPTSGDGDGVIQVTLQENTEPMGRNAQVTITRGNATNAVTIMQNPLYVFEASLSGEGNSRIIEITSNYEWLVMEKNDWITLDAENGVESAIIHVTLADNFTTSTRTGRVTLYCGDQTVTLPITQEKTETINATMSGEGDRRNITVESNSRWTATVSDRWIKLDKAVGIGNGTVRVTLDANNTGSARSGNITFTCGDVTRRIDVTQERTDSIDAAQSGTGNTRIITVTASGAWTASESLSWLALDKTSGTGNGTITVSMEPNTGNSAREGVVTLQCGSKTTTVEITQEKTDDIRATVSGSGNTRTITVTANGRWTATENFSWMTLNKNSGNGNDTITVSLEANQGSAAREGVVTFRCGSASDTVRIEQEKEDDIRATVAGSGNTYTITVTANGAWTASRNASWVTLSKNSGTGNDTITVTLAANSGSAAREATVMLRCGTDSETVRIVQEKTDAISATLSGSGNTRTITVTANGSWTATENFSWMTLNKTRGTGNDTITVSMESNTGAADREGAVTFRCGTASTTVTIMQEKEDDIRATQSGSGETRTITVAANGAWTATENASWLSLNKTRGNGNDSITVTLEPNTGRASRDATVTLRCGTDTATVRIVQEKTDSISATVTGSGNTRIINVTANGSWTATENFSWMTLSKTSGTGNDTITVSMESNTGAADREGAVTFRCGTASTTVTIMQEKEDVITATATGTGNTRTIAVAANGGWTVTSNATWMTFDKSRGNVGEDTVTVTLLDNTTSSDRTATATFRCGAAVERVAIVQPPTRQISVSATGTGNTRTINVTASGSWTSSETTSWLTLSRTSGNGNSTTTATMEPNRTNSARMATITFTCNGQTAELTITQEKTDNVSLTQSGSGNTRTINVTANGSWTASDDASWITLSKTRGTGNDTITATLTANNGSSSRAGTVTVRCGSATQSVTITQGVTRTFEVTGATRNTNGNVNVTWTDSANNGPYTVLYRQKTVSTWQAQQSTDFILWNAGQTTNSSSKTFTLTRLVPGVAYWIVVRDSDGAEVQYVYNPGSVVSFSEFGNALDVTLKTRTNTSNSTSTVSNFSARDIASNLTSKTYGIYVRNQHATLASARQYQGLITIRDPRGQVAAVHYGSVSYSSGSADKTWSFVPLNDFLTAIKQEYNSIPTGTYMIYYYLDGKYVAMDSFAINQ